LRGFERKEAVVVIDFGRDACKQNLPSLFLWLRAVF